MWSTLKSELNYHDQSYRVQPIIKNRLENDVTYRIGVISLKNDTDLSRVSDIMRSMIKMRQDNDVTNHSSLLYTKNQTELADEYFAYVVPS